MTRIGVMSDTHGNRPLMHAVADRLATEFMVETIIHLGDSYADAEELRFAGHPVLMVPGLWCPEYSSGRVRRFLVERIGGLLVAAAHTDRDLRTAFHEAAVVLTGHTHVARIVHADKRIHMNPGHLKGGIHRGETPSFGVIEIGPDAVRACIHEASGALREALEVPANLLL